jgi:two-component system, OmpR family, phosphate regulon response regulator PhoB
MAEQTRVVALLVTNPALSSILSMVLAAVPSLRVRPFQSQVALSTYMRLAPVDLIVADFDSETAPADAVAHRLRDDPQGDRRNVQIIALAGAVTPEIKRASIGAGIDEIIVKPMSPKYLLERVLSRLQRQAPRALRPLPARSSPSRIDLARAGSNVIPLFGRRLEPTH